MNLKYLQALGLFRQWIGGAAQKLVAGRIAAMDDQLWAASGQDLEGLGEYYRLFKAGRQTSEVLPRLRQLIADAKSNGQGVCEITPRIPSGLGKAMLEEIRAMMREEYEQVAIITEIRNAMTAEDGERFVECARFFSGDVSEAYANAKSAWAGLRYWKQSQIGSRQTAEKLCIASHDGQWDVSPGYAPISDSPVNSCRQDDFEVVQNIDNKTVLVRTSVKGPLYLLSIDRIDTVFLQEGGGPFRYRILYRVDSPRTYQSVTGPRTVLGLEAFWVKRF